ncbi:MAG: D-sedoheptulose-7-phosphate isomerase [Bacteroidota bacterium]
MAEIRNRFNELNELLTKTLENYSTIKSIKSISETITEAYRLGNKTVFCGNGGSAAEAQHLAAELSGKFNIDRAPIPAEACHVNPSFVTAVSNDYDFSKVYARYIEAFCQKGDVLIGLSTSGNSPNIISAFEKAREMGVKTVAMSGETGGKLAAFADYIIKIQSSNVPRIQEMHLLVGHIICEMVENDLFGSKK